MSALPGYAIVVRGGVSVAVRVAVAGAVPVKTTPSADPAATAKTINILSDQLNAAMLVVRSNPRLYSITFEDVAVGGGGVTVNLQHNLGGRVRWAVTDFYGAAGNVPTFSKNTTLTTNTTLVLTSLYAGTATIEVWLC